MLSAKALALLLLLATVAACGSLGPTPTPTATQNLEARAVAAYSSALDRNWLEQYQYTSLRSRDVCDSAGYAAKVANLVSLIRGFMSINEDATFEFRVRDVQVTGEEGAVFIEYLSDGELIPLADEGRHRWVFLNGMWGEEHQAWQVGCAGWRLFEQR